jgi:hypothetical protein
MESNTSDIVMIVSAGISILAVVGMFVLLKY